MKKWFQHNRQKAQNFLPHNFSPQVELLENDICVLITRLAYEKTWHYVDIADKEVGWLGTADKVENSYLIEDVFLLDQEISATTTELSKDGLVNFATDILSKPDGEIIYQRIRFWGHSHVNIGTDPSPQDDFQMDIFTDSGHDFFIRGIFNKCGKACFTVYCYDLGIKILDVPWEIYEPKKRSIRKEIEAEFVQKVREFRSVIIVKKNLQLTEDKSIFEEEEIKNEHGISATAPFILARKAQEPTD